MFEILSLKQITVKSKQAYIYVYMHRCLCVCTDMCTYMYIYSAFISIYLWVKISVFSIFKNSLNLFKTHTQILPNIACVRKPYIDWMWNSKEMKDSFSCFFSKWSVFFFFFLICIDSLFRIRVLLNKVAETLQTSIKKKKNCVLQIWYLFYNKKRINKNSLGLEESPNTGGI